MTCVHQPSESTNEGEPTAAVGGLLCIGAVGIVAALLPSFVRYDARTDAHAVRERERRAIKATMHPA